MSDYCLKRQATLGINERTWKKRATSRADRNCYRKVSCFIRHPTFFCLLLVRYFKVKIVKKVVFRCPLTVYRMKSILLVLCFVAISLAQVSPPTWPTAFSATILAIRQHNGRAREDVVRWFYDYSQQKERYDIILNRVVNVYVYRKTCFSSGTFLFCDNTKYCLRSLIILGLMDLPSGTTSSIWP